jgi:uncharacterized protein
MTASRPHLLGVLAGLFLAAGLVTSATLLTRTWVRIADSETVTVTGSARRNVSSDLVVWRGSVAVEGTTLLEAQSELQKQVTAIQGFLGARGFSNQVFQPISIGRLQTRVTRGGDTTFANSGFRLSQSVELRSPDIDRVLAMDGATVELVRQGIEFTSGTPEFIWTQAGEAKIDMLADASLDARARADQMARQGGRAVSRLRSARMGVFQITPLHSTQTAWDGMNDTSSREKTVTAVVNAVFALQ